jgi:hypothetical protein
MYGIITAIEDMGATGLGERIYSDFIFDLFYCNIKIFNGFINSNVSAPV